MIGLLILSRTGHGRRVPGRSGAAENTVVSSKYHDRGVMCCATNPEGQECSQLYDYGK